MSAIDSNSSSFGLIVAPAETLSAEEAKRLHILRTSIPPALVNSSGIDVALAVSHVKEKEKVEEAVMALAKQAISSETAESLEKFLTDLPLFKIGDQKFLMELAWFCAESFPLTTMKYMHQLGIAENQELLLKIAQKIGKIYLLARILGDLKIANQEILCALAMLIATKDTYNFLENVGKFGILSQTRLVELARLVSSKTDYRFAFCCTSEDWGIMPLVESEEDRFEIAMLALTLPDADSGIGKSIRLNDVVYYIKKFRLNEAHRIHIAKIHARSPDSDVELRLAELEIDDQVALKEILHTALLSLIGHKMQKQDREYWDGDLFSFYQRIDSKPLTAFLFKGVEEKLAWLDATSMHLQTVNIGDWIKVQKLLYAILVDRYSIEERACLTERGKVGLFVEKKIEEEFVVYQNLIKAIAQIGSVDEKFEWAAKIFFLFSSPEHWLTFSTAMKACACPPLPLAMAMLITQDPVKVRNFAFQLQEDKILDKEGTKLLRMIRFLSLLFNAALPTGQKEEILLNQYLEYGCVVHSLLAQLKWNDKSSCASERKREINAKLLTSTFASCTHPPVLKDLAKLANPSTLFAIKTHALKNIFLIQTKAKRLADERIRMLSFFLSLNKGNLIAKPQTLDMPQLITNRTKAILEAFNLKGMDIYTSDQFQKIWAERILSCRDPDAIYVYYAKIASLSKLEMREKMQASYAEWVEALIHQSVPRLRGSSPHLLEMDKLFKANGDYSATWPAQCAIWLADSPLRSFKDFFSPESHVPIPRHVQFKYLLEHTLGEGHIVELEKKLPRIAQYLKGEGYPESHLKELSDCEVKNEAEQALVNVQKLCFSLCSERLEEESEKNLTALYEAVCLLRRKHSDWQQWAQDILEFKTGLENAHQKIAYDNWQIGITQDPFDLILLARETAGCQSIYGNPNLNKCALAYVKDGKNKALVIKDNFGKIVARNVLRLLYDKDSHRPVLFLERHYTRIANMGFVVALNNAARHYAAQLQLPLLTVHAMEPWLEKKPYKGRICSLGCNAPFEYTDAGGGETDGNFTIIAAYQM